MNRLIKCLFFCLIIVMVILFLDFKIKSHDMRFYFGKDNGVTYRIYSTIILSSLFYLFLSNRNRIQYFFIGILVGFFSIFFGLWFMHLDFLDKIVKNTGLYSHILGCLLFIVIFFTVDKIKKKKLKKE